MTRALRQVIRWLRAPKTLPPNPCPWCQKELSLIECPACHGKYGNCPTCALGLVCPAHGRFWAR